MKVLFIHPNFPAQFRYLCFALGQHLENEVIFATKNENPQWKLQGVRKALYTPSRKPNPSTHHYVKSLESSVLEGQAVYRLATQLKAEGFIPDLIYGHSGWGGTLFMRDLFPNTPLMCYFEWFYHAYGSDADFDPSDPLSFDDELRIRMKNNSILVDLYTCQQGVSPTKWQQSQFPPEFRDKITVLHDGVDIDYFKPNPQAKLILPNLDLSHVSEIVTYVSRGMEPYRGFPQLIEAIAHLQQRRPHCHVVIVGADRVAYGKSLPDGKSYKQAMLEKFPLDLSRVHFTGSLPYNQYLRVIQASSVHIYLTRPFVLSWSMLEAMSTGCLVIGSNTAPVRELIKDGENGLLVDFFSPQAIADRVDEVLDSGDGMKQLRVRARETIVENYALKKLVPQHLKLMADLAKCSLQLSHYELISRPKNQLFWHFPVV